MSSNRNEPLFIFRHIYIKWDCLVVKKKKGAKRIRPKRRLQEKRREMNVRIVMEEEIALLHGLKIKKKTNYLHFFVKQQPDKILQFFLQLQHLFRRKLLDDLVCFFVPQLTDDAF